MTRFLSVLCAVLLTAAPAAAQRLTDAVIPEHYSLWFAPDLEKETFRGRQTIDAVLTQPGTTITLNAAEIEFGEVRITSGGRTQVATVTTDPKTETATFTRSEEHTSELQSQSNLVCRLLLEKKNT